MDLLKVRNEDMREILDVFLEERNSTLELLQQEHPEILDKMKQSGKLLEYDLLRAKAKAEIS